MEVNVIEFYCAEIKFYQYSMTSVLLRIKIFLVENSEHRAVFNVFALGT